MTKASATSEQKVVDWASSTGGGLIKDCQVATGVDRSTINTVLNKMVDRGECRKEQVKIPSSSQRPFYFTYTPKVVVPTSLLVGDDAARVRVFLKHCPEARSDHRKFAGFIDFENVKELPVKKKGLKITAMGVFDRAA